MLMDLKMARSGNDHPDRLIVLLHGRMNTGTEMEAVAQRWGQALPDAMFLLPRGPLVCSEDAERFEWFRGDGSDRFPEGTLDAAAEKLVDYMQAASQTYNVPCDRIVLAGYSEGMTVAFYVGLTKVLDVAALVGFNGTLYGLRSFDTNVVKTPPTLIVQGDSDPHLPPATLGTQKAFLSSLGVPVTTLLRAGIGHFVDVHGADASVMYLRGLFETRQSVMLHTTSNDTTPKPTVAKTGLEFAKSLKALIWDLDDTLWKGTLDEGEVHLIKSRVEAIRALNASGLVSAICSKNDPQVARAKLEAFGLWDAFVFPRIAFVPKGPALKALIEDIQLKPKQILFLDDNHLNLQEAVAVVPEINVVDASTGACDVLLAQIVAAHADINKSRVAEYRALEARVNTRVGFEGSREDFLHSCDLRICVIWCGDLVDYCGRIEELINRTNQLNFLRSRVAPGSMVGFVAEPMMREGYAVFAWDKFGYHGLIGFLGVDIRSETIVHMAFSCRVMHMGIENHLLAKALERFPCLKSPIKIDVVPRRQSWIKEEEYSDPKIYEFIRRGEKEAVPTGRPALRIMANCQSGVWAHYSGLRAVAEIDNWPRHFHMAKVMTGAHKTESLPRAIVYGSFVDYFDDLWPDFARHEIDTRLYDYCVQTFCDYLAAGDHHLLVIGSPSGMPEWSLHPQVGITAQRIENFRRIWAKHAAKYAFVTILDVDTIVTPARMLDDTHFSVEASQDIAKSIALWFDALPVATCRDLPSLAG